MRGDLAHMMLIKENMISLLIRRGDDCKEKDDGKGERSSADAHEERRRRCLQGLVRPSHIQAAHSSSKAMNRIIRMRARLLRPIGTLATFLLWRRR